ncbi:MAG: type II toxin-antitoxin system prevent-host-death family antitoxin [Micrococcales bacterium]|nr:type II toxin-antitoxin system prevent-host-death family antitoxin [Micrococcales bacterium]
MLNVATNQPTSAVGLRQLRANLSGYIDDVKAGHTYTLTEHGKPVAHLVPVNGQSAYERLLANGLIEPARRRPSGLAAPVATAGTVSDLVSQQRR